MREIKFRAWDKKRKEIRPVYSINNLDENDDYEFKYVVSNQNIDGQGIIDWIDLELMQYTGLKDKNGKEIYEGDIIEAVNFVHKPKTIVRWSDEAAGFMPFIEQGFDLYYTDLSYWCNLSRNKVVGNIYENPELMESIK